MKKFFEKFRHGEKGFTLVELLVVVAILGVLAAVAVPNVGSFIRKGKTESYSTELHNIQTGVMAMLAEDIDGLLDSVPTGFTSTMSDVAATIPGPTGPVAKTLADYMTGLNEDFTVKTGCTYSFTTDGTVTQHPPTTP